MTRNRTHLARALAMLVVMTTLGPWTRSAGAQTGTSASMGMGMGVGMGMGMGMGGFHYASSPTAYLNQRAFYNAGRAGAPASQGSIGGNPNAYYNKVRDDGFDSHYDRRFRQAAAERSQHRKSSGDQVHRQPAADSTAAAFKPKQAIPLSNFFDASEKLVWPGEAHAEIGLKEKREIFERASLAVLAESKKQGQASLATTTAARQKLLDYGRPALQQVRASSTPEVADRFHQFLLSLYNSLAGSAVPPEIRPGSASKP